MVIGLLVKLLAEPEVFWGHSFQFLHISPLTDSKVAILSRNNHIALGENRWFQKLDILQVFLLIGHGRINMDDALL